MSFNKSNLYFLFLILITLSSCQTYRYKKGLSLDYCKTKYPVYFVHGIGLRDKTKLLDYWGAVVPVVEEYGAVCFRSDQNAFGLIEENAQTLKKEINQYLVDNPEYKKVNIVAHSRGGLEARFMLSELDMEDKVASLTTISTPHRGSVVADLVIQNVSSKDNPAVQFIDSAADITGDRDPTAFNSGFQLTRVYMVHFNDRIIDSDKVYYQSYAGLISKRYLNLIWSNLYSLIEPIEGPNDGLVSVESAKWGDYKGIPLDDTRGVISHADIVGLGEFSEVYLFDVEKFYLELLNSLKNMGY